MKTAAMVGLLGALAASGAAANEREVTVCADPDPPPSVYWVRDAQGHKTQALTGFGVDLMNEAFARLGVKVRWIGHYPWARCMKEVEDGRTDFAYGAYYSEERARRFAYSVPLRALTPQVFSMRDRPVDVRSKADLKRYAGCGLTGASYAHYDLGPADLDTGVNTYAKLITKLKLGRCDYFVEELEVILRLKDVGQDLLADEDLVHGPVPDATAPTTHLIAGKASAAAARLPELDAVLIPLIRSGEAARYWRRHSSSLPYKPGKLPS